MFFVIISSSPTSESPSLATLSIIHFTNKQQIYGLKHKFIDKIILLSKQNVFLSKAKDIGIQDRLITFASQQLGIN